MRLLTCRAGLRSGCSTGSTTLRVIPVCRMESRKKSGICLDALKVDPLQRVSELCLARRMASSLPFLRSWRLLVVGCLAIPCKLASLPQWCRCCQITYCSRSYHAPCLQPSACPAQRPCTLQAQVPIRAVMTFRCSERRKCQKPMLAGQSRNHNGLFSSQDLCNK